MGFRHFLVGGALVFFSLNLFSSRSVFGVDPPGLEPEVGITEHLGARISAEHLHFQDEKDQTVYLKSYLTSHRPILLTLIYFECPNLCSLVLNGLVHALRELDWNPGHQFEIVVVSINPLEKPALAGKKKETYVQSYGRPETLSGWHFLTGEISQIQQLAAEVGFHFKKEGTAYAHGAAVYVLTPEGKISRYLYGTDFKSTEIKEALQDAGAATHPIGLLLLLISMAIVGALFFLSRKTQAVK